MVHSEDGFLGNRLIIRQPRHGHRSGHDAVLLAASVGGEKAQSVCDLGAGAGVVGFCILARLPETQLVGVEIDPDLCRLARNNAVTNGFAERARFVAGDIAGPFSALGLEPNSFDHVVANPPFTGDRVPPVQDLAGTRASDGCGGSGKLGAVCVCTGWPTASSLLFTAEALDDLLSAMRGRLGALKVQPVAARAGEAPIGAGAGASRCPHAFGAVAADCSAKCDRRAKRRSRSGFAHGAALAFA